MGLIRTALLEPGVHVSVHRALRDSEKRFLSVAGGQSADHAPGWLPGLAGLTARLDDVRVVLVTPSDAIRVAKRCLTTQVVQGVSRARNLVIRRDEFSGYRYMMRRLTADSQFEN